MYIHVDNLDLLLILIYLQNNCNFLSYVEFALKDVSHVLSLNFNYF